MTAQRMVHFFFFFFSGGQQGKDLLPENELLLMYGGRAGTEGTLLRKGKPGELPE